MSSNYQDLYKKSLDRGEQQKLRQQELLKQQKLRRQQVQDDARPINKTEESPTKQHRKQRGKDKGTPFRLQLSEWLRNKPDNLVEWLLVPCPVGKRCMVIATNGKTKVYNKAGKQFMTLRTLLPGDNHVQKCRTVLDCVYDEKTQTFYVLDALSFGQQSLQNCEASFRFYWLRARFEEDDFAEKGAHNDKSFVLLNHYDFEDASAIEEILQKYPIWTENQPKLDGFLFYHKEASYVCGTTPLVCWLFSYMLPDVLDLPVNSNYVAPEDYQPRLVLQYMEEFDQKLKEQRKQQAKESVKKSWEKKEQDENPETSMETNKEEEDGDSDEYAGLKSLLDHQRRLELGELDMDCEETPSAS
ncbi:snurportin-1 [Drosophila pseudoobscura]|uniref:Snurportin-1 n=1 Tax=Drosophila pseudoobscura pseudoobscura TaxID=46245 RepID=A0A0R3P2Q3_DROPS|nr:snurportin-1 [Drosophila pseudoobscura]